VITAVVLITAEKGALPKLGEALAAVEGVSEVYSVTGDFDFVAMVRAREHDELADIVTRRIGQVPGVVRTDTHVAFKMYSRHDLESLFSIGADQPAKRA
jgi:DNA-binding Lrp family transcriptional regulator